MPLKFIPTNVKYNDSGEFKNISIPADRAYMGEVITISSTQPTNSDNKLWIDTNEQTVQTYQIPTMVDMANYRTAAAQDAIDATQNGNLATIESSSATAAHAVGEYIVLNGQLYKVTAAISAGQTLTVGTNIESTNVANIIQNYSTTTIIDNYNGYVKFDSGLLMQWGRTLYDDDIAANSTTTTTVQLNTPFSTTAYSANVSLHTSYPHLRSISVYSQTVNGMTITLGNSSSSAVTSTVYIYWLCIGFWK